MKIHTKKAAYFLGILLLMLPFAFGLECAIDKDPFIRLTSTPSAFCIPDNIENGDCVTWLSNPDDNNEIWGAMPERTNVEGIGSIDFYESRGTATVVEFSKDRLFDNKTITFNIRCGNEQTSYNVTPHFTQYEKSADWWLWSRQNINFLIMFGIELFALLALILWLWRNA